MIHTIIVEDDPMVAKINQQYLARYPDIQIDHIFRNSREALAYILSHKPDLIILDIYMPYLSGIDLLQEIRAAGISSDVIMVTAANETAMVNRALQLGIVDYLIKPFEKARFQEAVDQYLSKWSLLQKQQVISQNVVDRLIRSGNVSEHNPEIRKGLNKHTLKMICDYLSASGDMTHTCTSISEATGLSLVTIRRYLNYLTEIGFVTSIVDYETGGRPCMRYKI